MTAANIVTLARVALVPVIVYLLIEGLYPAAFATFLLAGLSDAVDGAIARFFDQRSRLGVILDPLADKLMLVCVFVVLGFLQALPVWLVIAVVSRDVVILAGLGVAQLMGRPMPVRPLMVSKVNTTAQIALAALVMLALALDEPMVMTVRVLVWIVAVSTALSLVAYTLEWTRHIGAEQE